MKHLRPRWLSGFAIASCAGPGVFFVACAESADLDEGLSVASSGTSAGGLAWTDRPSGGSTMTGGLPAGGEFPPRSPTWATGGHPGSGAGAGGGPGWNPGAPLVPPGTAPSTPDVPCVRGAIRGSEVIFLGDSYVGIPGTLQSSVESLARAAGALPAGEQYRSYAVLGAPLAGGVIGLQYQVAKAGGPVKVVIMDGGGTDILLLNPLCLAANPAAMAPPCVTSVNVALGEGGRLLAQMASDGVEDVVYFFYPDVPIAFGDILAYSVPLVKQLCDAQARPRCHFIDTRPAFRGQFGLIGFDGIHPTVAGAQVIAGLIWQTMVSKCVAQ